MFRQLEAFHAVVQAGSFVGAAERLGTSKAAVSRLVLELEARLQTRLLHRTTRRLSLTDTGADYAERSRHILEDLEQANAAASAGAVRVAGTLKVNAPLTFGNLHLAPLWGEFLKLHPDIELDVTLTDRIVDLVEEGFDLAVRITRQADSTLVTRQIATDRMLLCASPAYLARHPAIHHLLDLQAHSVMAYSWWSGGDQWALRDAAGLEHRVTTHARLRANSGDTCRAAALADQGVIYQPGFLVADDIRHGRLVRLLPQLQGAPIAIHVVYPTRKHLPGKVRAMVDFLVSAFQIPAWL